MKLYCTYLTIYSGNKLPPFYIGYTTVEKISKGYRGSVESQNYKAIWRSEQKVNPHLFKTVIRTTHSSKAEAIAREVSFQKALKILQNPLYINKAIGRHCDRTGMKESQETRQKKKGKRNAAGRKDPPWLIEQKRNRMLGVKRGKYKTRCDKGMVVSKLRGIKQSPEHILKRSLARLGKKRGPYKKRMEMEIA
jgi:hypothetical protein